MRFLILRRVVIGGLALFFAISLMSVEISGSPEMYPFFNWQLFSYIPNEKDEFSIEVYRIGSREYDPPLQYADMTSLFVDAGAAPTEYTPRIRELAKAVKEEDPERIRQAREEIDVLFGRNEYAYGILEVRLDPVEYWKTGEYASSTVLRVFESDE